MRTLMRGEPHNTLDRFSAAAQLAEETQDQASVAALCACALSFMLLDWSNFVGWRDWISRFERSKALLLPQSDLEESHPLALVLATGEVSCSLLQGDSNAVLAPLGQHLERLLGRATDPLLTTLAACSLLPWLQMSRNPAAAQAIHACVIGLACSTAEASVGDRYLYGVWTAKWAQNVHFNEPSRFLETLEKLDQFLVANPIKPLCFLRAKLVAEHAMAELDSTNTELALREMLNAMDSTRPMQRAIYNNMVTLLACTQNDPLRAAAHLAHMQRELSVADCPPSLAMFYRTVESRVCLLTRDYARAAEILDEQTHAAHTAHVAQFHGFAELARALHAHQREGESRDMLRTHLLAGLNAMRAVPNQRYFVAVPEARAAVSALALREGIESEFVLAALKTSPVAPPSWADEHWPWALSLRCFGGFRSQGLAPEGKSANRASNKPLSLLMLVAASGAQGLPVAVAADALWPGQDGDQAENALSVTLLRLRRLYDEGDLIERRGGWLHLNAHRVWTDVTAFEAHLDVMLDRSALISETKRLQYINRLFDLYRGDCLFSIEDDWARQRASHYRGRVTLASQRMLQDALHTNCYAAAEFTMTRVFERGLDVSRLLAAVHPDDRGTPAWKQLQQCVDALQNA